jgi:hypothetical protein
MSKEIDIKSEMSLKFQFSQIIVVSDGKFKSSFSYRTKCILGLLMRIENFPLMDNLAVSNMFLHQYSIFLLIGQFFSGFFIGMVTLDL